MPKEINKTVYNFSRLDNIFLDSQFLSNMYACKVSSPIKIIHKIKMKNKKKLNSQLV